MYFLQYSVEKWRINFASHENSFYIEVVGALFYVAPVFSFSKYTHSVLAHLFCWIEFCCAWNILLKKEEEKRNDAQRVHAFIKLFWFKLIWLKEEKKFEPLNVDTIFNIRRCFTDIAA